MRIGVLGTGDVGRTLAGRLAADGHEVMLGSRTADNAAAVAWATGVGERASHGTFADAADADLVFNCTPGSVSLDVLATAGERLDGKVLVDVANPLDFSGGFPPTLTISNTTSLAEEIQRAHPALKVVKALNTINHLVMVNPGRVEGSHHVFVCGDDEPAKSLVKDLLTGWGWPATSIVDLGDLTGARGMEMVLPLWVRLYATLGTGDFNLAVARAPGVDF